jgi:transcriptional regulator
MLRAGSSLDDPLNDSLTKTVLSRIFIVPLRSMIEWSTLKRMPRRESPLQSEMLQGTLDMLVLQTLVLGPAHGHTIAHAIERGSDDVLQVEHGSLYPALHRLEDRGWIASFWGTSENNRKARYYRLTAAGRKQLIAQTTRWGEVVRAIGRILKPAAE